MLLVKITSNQGATGWAECSPMNAYLEEAIIQKVLKPLLIGRNPIVPLHWKRRFWDCPPIYCTGIVEA